MKIKIQRNLSRYAAMAFVFGVLYGCAAPQPKPLPLVPQKQTVVIPTGLLLDCQDLSKLTPHTAYSQGQSVDVISTWSAEHRDCSQRFKAVRNLIAKAFNINIDEQGNVISAPSTTSTAK